MNLPLTTSAVGMAAYGLYSLGWALVDLLGPSRLEFWADLALILFGAVLTLAAAFVRAEVPGGLALAIGALLALQAFALHNAAHLYGTIAVVPQVARGILAALLVALASVEGREPSRND